MNPVVLAENYAGLLLSIKNALISAGRKNEDIELVAVTKNRPIEDIWSLYRLGCRTFGESRTQEALPKIAALPTDCSWHMIGSLQKNKARKAVENFAMIESVDSVELAEKISRISLEADKKTDVLLEVNISREASKSGLNESEWKQSFSLLRNLPGIKIQGLMTMAPFVEDRAVIRSVFKGLRELRDELPGIGPHLSMGMSHDYLEAIAEGATILRIGSLLFSPK